MLGKPDTWASVYECVDDSTGSKSLNGYFLFFIFLHNHPLGLGHLQTDPLGF